MRAAEHLGEAARGHRARDADFALAADFGAGDRRVLLVQDADRAGGQQEIDRCRRRSPSDRSAVVVHDGRDDAGGAVGRRGDDAAAGGVLLVDRERVQVDPVEDRQRIAQRGFRTFAQILGHRRRAALHVQAAGQHAAFADAARDASLPSRARSSAGRRGSRPRCARLFRSPA